jgi:hypothetical protein
MQTSFLDNLIGASGSDEEYGDVVFPKGFEVRDFETLRRDFELLANRYGLSLPAKLKKGQLVLEWKPFPGESSNSYEGTKKFALTSEEINAFQNVFE